MDSFVSGIDDAARLVTAIGSVAIALAIFRFVRGRPDLSMRARRLAAVFAVLVLFIGALSFLANLDGTGYVPSMQSAVRVAVAAFTVVGAVTLWRNLAMLLRMPSPGYAASEQRRLALELASALQRYEMALRGSNVAIFTQDRELRYTSVSKPLFGFPVEKVLGASDAELLGEAPSSAVGRLKREAIDTNEPRKGEIEVEEAGGPRWYDLHIESLRDIGGATIGLTGAAVDVTERKENERHLRLLMRELTHRSKNLLAVIQAMARQTARHAGTTDDFVDQFSARLQALARSHDLLVQESWHGASLNDMVRSQLGHHLDRDSSQVSVTGPDILLRPEAAQNLGLALHELSTNAAKFGALSVPGGHVAIAWARRSDEKGGGIRLEWKETGGPPVRKPEGRGFGSLVIERNLSRALDGEVSLEFAPTGLICRVTVPEQHLSPGR